MRLSKDRRITRGSDFRRVRELGESFRGRNLVLGVLRDPGLEGFKAGFITTKRLGNAVVRNRVRRRLRAILTEVGEGIEPGCYLVTIARFRAPDASYEALLEEWKGLGRKAGIFRRTSPPE